MRLAADVQAVGLSLFLQRSRTLIVSDLHIGAEGSLVRKGFLVPRTQQRILMQRLESLVKHTNPLMVVLLGDVKHEFGAISAEEWRDALAVFDLFEKYALKVHVVLGNHDVLLKPVLAKRAISCSDHFLVDDCLLIHGDVAPANGLLDKRVKLVISGHEHPTVLLGDGVRSEKYKAFYRGSYMNKTLIVMPSFYPLVEGSDFLVSGALGPVLKVAEDLEAFVVADNGTILPFGPLRDLQRNL